MKKILPGRKPELFFKALVLLAAALAVLLIAGTIFGFAKSSDAGPLLTLGKSGRTAQHAGSPLGVADDGINVFSGIGRLRIPLSNSSTLILFVAFPYQSNDLAFTEELAAKIGEFRSIASDYFSSLPPEKLSDIDENAAKTEILRLYNAGLRLGRIETLYFSDMIVLATSLSN